jgi:formylglycine-generating enzyme required for sulfatase activity
LILSLPSFADLCVGDLNADRTVAGEDLGILLNQWGSASSGDFNGDGIVDGADLSYLLNAWGECPVTVPSWATLVEARPSGAVTNPTLREAITASGMAWRVLDTATQMEMLLVPAGTFMMGNPSPGYPAENPMHSVTLTQAFYIGRYEVTQEQWVASMGSNPSIFAGATRPVDGVGWGTVQGYLSATGMRLPSEAEWECACRAGTTTQFYNGQDDPNNIGNIAWYFPNSGSRTRPVGGKSPNALGLYDMSGNVWEWVNDYFDSNYYSVSPPTNPLGPVSGGSHVLRGGSWREIPFNARSPSRSPGFTDNTVGFRVARNP